MIDFKGILLLKAFKHALLKVADLSDYCQIRIVINSFFIPCAYHE